METNFNLILFFYGAASAHFFNLLVFKETTNQNRFCCSILSICKISITGLNKYRKKLVMVYPYGTAM